MGKGSRFGAGPCAKRQAEAKPRALDPPPSEAPPGSASPGGQSDTGRADTWSPLIRSSLVEGRSGSGSTSRPELRSAWGEEPLHPRKRSSRRLRLTQIAEERRERKAE